MKHSESPWLCAWLSLFFATAGCGGGEPERGAGGTAGNEGALHVLETTPANDATNVATDVEVSAVFDEALREATVTMTSFTLRPSQGEAMDASVTVVNEQTAVLTPDEPLALLTPHSATLTTEIESLSGQSLETDFSLSFTTRDGAWGPAQRIEADNAGDAGLPQIAVGADGIGIAVWHQSDGTRRNIWANRYTPAGGWGSAEIIEAGSGDATTPQIAIDLDGNALAVWHQSDGTRRNIWANRYTTAGGWGAAELIEADDTGDAEFPEIAIDPDGDASATWHQADGTRENIWANRYTTAGGWGAAELIEMDDTADARFPQIAADPNGNAIAVWYQAGGSRSIWANRYTPAGGWGAAELIEASGGAAEGPHVAVDPNGNALAVWYQDDGVRLSIWANRYTTTGGWGAAELIETDDAGNAIAARIAIAVSGNALAVWQQHDGIRRNIWANQYTTTGGWGAAERIEADNAGNALGPQIAIDVHGNALAVWRQHDGTVENIQANRYTSAGGWGSAELVETDDTGGAFEPQVAIDPNGNALTVWYQRDGLRANIWANRFD
jgi:uncharacterized protein with GYD domain